MRPLHLLSTGIALLTLAGCSAPSTDERADEHAITSIVALLAGYDSDGLTSLLSDLASDSLRSDESRTMVVPISGTGSAGERLRTLSRSRGGAGALGESRTRCAIRPAAVEAPGAGEALAVDVEATSVHASPTISIRATSHGVIELVSAGPLLERTSSGELSIDGALGERPSDGVPFSQVEATMSWEGLRLIDGENGGIRLDGAIAISIAARGQGGLVIRNGMLRVFGRDRGVLDLGGRHYPIDLRRAQAIR